MSDEAKTDTPARGPESPPAAPAAGSNGKATGRTARPAAATARPAAAASEPAPRLTGEPCEDCQPAGRDYSALLGWLIFGAAVAMAFIGADLASRGAISRRLGAAGWDESQS